MVCIEHFRNAVNHKPFFRPQQMKERGAYLWRHTTKPK